MSPFETFYMV